MCEPKHYDRACGLTLIFIMAMILVVRKLTIGRHQ